MELAEERQEGLAAAERLAAHPAAAPGQLQALQSARSSAKVANMQSVQGQHTQQISHCHQAYLLCSGPQLNLES